MELNQEMIELLNETKANLSGYARRHFMAQTVKVMCNDKSTKAEEELGWNRGTLRKAMEELALEKKAAEEAYKKVVPVLDSSATYGLISHNKAARHKSRMNAQIKAL